MMGWLALATLFAVFIMSVARFIKIMKRATGSGALPFVYLKFYSSQFYF
jgi:hypothetical protein